MLINFYCAIIKQSIDRNPLIGKQQWIKFYVGMFVITPLICLRIVQYYIYIYIYICIYIYIYLNLFIEHSGEHWLEQNIFYFRSPHHKHFGKVQHLVYSALWWHQLFPTRWPEPQWRVLGRTKHVSVEI